MGLSQSILSDSSVEFMQFDPTQKASIIDQTQFYTVYRNDRGQQYEKYIINRKLQEKKRQFLRNSQQYINEGASFQQNYEYRLTHRSKFLVELLYAAPKEKGFNNCRLDSDQYEVVTQRIKYRLSQLCNLSFENGFRVLSVGLKGFKNLCMYNGAMWIKDTMIGVNSENQVKVWLSPNFGSNYVESLPVSLGNMSKQKQEDIIVNNFMDMVSSKTCPSPQWQELMRMRYNPMTKQNSSQLMTFSKAERILEEIIQKFGMDPNDNKVVDILNERSGLKQLVREDNKKNEVYPQNLGEVRSYAIGNSIRNSGIRSQELPFQRNQSRSLKNEDRTFNNPFMVTSNGQTLPIGRNMGSNCLNNSMGTNTTVINNKSIPTQFKESQVNRQNLHMNGSQFKMMRKSIIENTTNIVQHVNKQGNERISTGVNSLGSNADGLYPGNMIKPSNGVRISFGNGNIGSSNEFRENGSRQSSCFINGSQQVPVFQPNKNDLSMSNVGMMKGNGTTYYQYPVPYHLSKNMNNGQSIYSSNSISKPFVRFSNSSQKSNYVMTSSANPDSFSGRAYSVENSRNIVNSRFEPGKPINFIVRGDNVVIGKKLCQIGTNENQLTKKVQQNNINANMDKRQSKLIQKTQSIQEKQQQQLESKLSNSISNGNPSQQQSTTTILQQIQSVSQTYEQGKKVVNSQQHLKTYKTLSNKSLGQQKGQIKQQSIYQKKLEQSSKQQQNQNNVNQKVTSSSNENHLQSDENTLHEDEEQQFILRINEFKTPLQSSQSQAQQSVQQKVENINQSKQSNCPQIDQSKGKGQQPIQNSLAQNKYKRSSTTPLLYSQPKTPNTQTYNFQLTNTNLFNHPGNQIMQPNFSITTSKNQEKMPTDNKIIKPKNEVLQSSRMKQLSKIQTDQPFQRINQIFQNLNISYNSLKMKPKTDITENSIVQKSSDTSYDQLEKQIRKSSTYKMKKSPIQINLTINNTISYKELRQLLKSNTTHEPSSQSESNH